jgi:hypothetical protein
VDDPTVLRAVRAELAELRAQLAERDRSVVHLSDSEWRDIAATYLDQIGLAPRGERGQVQHVIALAAHGAGDLREGWRPRESAPREDVAALVCDATASTALEVVAATGVEGHLRVEGPTSSKPTPVASRAGGGGRKDVG